MPRNLIFHKINALALNGFCIDEFGLAVFGCAYFIKSVKYLLHVVSVDIIDLKAEGCRLCAQVDMRHDLIAGTIELETIIIYYYDEIVKLISICTHHRKCYRKTRRMKQSFGLYFFPGKGVRVMACKYLDFQDRKKIAKMYQEEARVLDIAYKIGCHPATIYEELRRGDTGKLDKNQRPEYDPRLAQRTFQEAIRRRGNRRTTTTAESGQ